MHTLGLDRRDELGEHGDLLPPPQRARARAAGRAAFGPAAALVVRFRRGSEAPACRRLGRVRRAADRRRAPARARRRRGAGDLHEHHAQAGRRGGGVGRRSRCSISPTRPRPRSSAAGAARPALLATRFTMEQDFYKGRLRDRHGIEAIVPDRGRARARPPHHLRGAVPGRGPRRIEGRLSGRDRAGCAAPAPMASSSAAPRSRC